MVAALLSVIGLALFKFFLKVLNSLKTLLKKFEAGDNNWFLWMINPDLNTLWVLGGPLLQAVFTFIDPISNPQLIDWAPL